jgi:hypothetical protein
MHEGGVKDFWIGFRHSSLACELSVLTCVQKCSQAWLIILIVPRSVLGPGIVSTASCAVEK